MTTENGTGTCDEDAGRIVAFTISDGGAILFSASVRYLVRLVVPIDPMSCNPDSVQ